MRLQRLLISGAPLATILLPQIARAQTIGAVDIVENIIKPIIGSFTPLLVTVAALLLIIAGVRTMTMNSESGLEKGKKAITAVFVGGIAVTLSGTAASILFQYGGDFIVNRGGDVNTQVAGLADWVSAMAAMIGLLIIIVSAFRAVASFGDEEGYKKVRTSVVHVVVGLAIITVNRTITGAVFGGNPNPLITVITDKITIALGLVTLLALVVIIYAGIRLVANFGNEEVYGQAKGIIFRAVLGLLTILFSYTMVQFVVSLFG